MEYFASIVLLIGLYIILATSFNLIFGYCGLVTIAHPAFFAIGAYTSGMLALQGVSIPLGMAAGTLLSGAVSLGLSLPALRISGDYLLIASIGFQLGIVEVINNLPWTGGPAGLKGIPPLFHGPYRVAYEIALVYFVVSVTVALTRALVKGPYGRAITAMRDDELAFVGMGRNAMRIKLEVVALGSALAGAAGGLYAHLFEYLSPEQFGIVESAAILTMVVVGGMRTLWGPVVGAVVLMVLPQAITFLSLPTSVAAALRGILFTGLVLFFLFVQPEGIIRSRMSVAVFGRIPSTTATGPPARIAGGGGARVGPVLEVRSVRKAFGGLVAVSDADLALERGEILALIGPNGAGKTTLFNLICGLIMPDCGEILFKGSRIDQLAMNRRALLGISRTWQDVRLFTSLTVLDNVVLGARAYDGESIARCLVHRRRVREQEKKLLAGGMEILARVGLAEVWDQPVSELPYGHQKLVGLARTLMNGGDVLLLDEPMAGVEGKAYETVKDVIRELAVAGRAVCIVEHNISFVRDLCTRAAFMFAGRIVVIGTTEEVLANPVVSELYFGQESLEARVGRSCWKPAT